MAIVFYFFAVFCLSVHQVRNRVPPNFINVLLITGTILGLMFGTALLSKGINKVGIEKTVNTVWEGTE